MKIPQSNNIWTAKGITFETEGDFGTFTLPTPEGSPEDYKPIKIRVSVTGEHINLFPERSASQKQLMTLLGI